MYKRIDRSLAKNMIFFVIPIMPNNYENLKFLTHELKLTELSL